jgi:hypothetical protein
LALSSRLELWPRNGAGRRRAVRELDRALQLLQRVAVFQVRAYSRRSDHRRARTSDPIEVRGPLLEGVAPLLEVATGIVGASNRRESVPEKPLAEVPRDAELLRPVRACRPAIMPISA